MSNNYANQEFEQLSEKLICQHWNFYPPAGARLGRHEYDGRLPDLSPQQISRREQELKAGLVKLESLANNGLDPTKRMSYRMMELFLKRELFTFTELRPLENNPMRQCGFLDISGYILRDYAPLEDRLRSASATLAQVPNFLETIDLALTDSLSKHIVDMSVESYSGMAQFYRTDLASVARSVTDTEIVKEFLRNLKAATSSLERFVKQLKTRSHQGETGFAIGRSLYSGMLATAEGLDSPLSEIAAVGEVNLSDNLAHIKDVAEIISPGESVAAIVAEIGKHHPTAQSLIGDTRDLLESIRQALIDFDVISVPSEDRCQVIETPTYMRYAFAAMDSAGTLETKATESFYYLTPVSDEWNAAQREEWLSNFNYETLKVISVHEVYPGHFVHHLHNRYGHSLPLINRALTSYAFSEGWAHYTEQMMVETEYGSGKPALLFTQLLEALVRNCRYICSIRMHTEDMTVDEATKFFMENSYMAELPARREALRGTFDPGYLNYTLGKLMILKLREDYRQKHGINYNLRDFHDRLLSFGSPPLPLLREAMLGETGNPL